MAWMSKGRADSVFSKGFPHSKQITYAGMLWLIAAQIVVMLPLMFHLPLWLIPVLIFSAGWRIRVMQGHLTQPGNIVKLMIGGLGFAALAASGLPTVSLDMMASLLMLGFAYKSLEVIQQRDGMVVVLTGYLLVAVQFLYSQSMFSALYGIFSLTVLTGAMIAIQQAQQVKSKGITPNLKLAGAMLLMCLPLMITLFVFAPRFSPLWSFSLPSSHAKTGITDRMTPGDIASLSQSDELAFRVTFSGERPPQNELYWRGLVLQHFDGKTWTQFADDPSPETVKSRLRSYEHDARKRLQKKGYGRAYDVIYEKSGQPWLFALSPVVAIEGDAIYSSDFNIMARKNILEPMLLKLISFPQALREIDLPQAIRRLALQLPKVGKSEANRKSRALAKRLLESSVSQEDYIQKVLNLYKQDFYYTLRPPVLNSRNSIDHFLLGSKKGFCAHYAGSFVYMMRVAGIPARVIAGYQGGEWNEKSNYLAVHQYDAHAWTEVWLEGQGWVRFDPTTMVAPERVEQNLQTAVSEEGSFLEDQILSSVKYQWLGSLRKQVDATQYSWRKFVLGYDQEAQSHFIKRLFGEISLLKIGLIAGAIILSIITLWVLFLGLTKKHKHEAIEHQLYRSFCDLLEKQGIKRTPSQSPAEFSQRASAQIPELATEIRSFSELYTALCYDPDTQSKTHEHIDRLKKMIKAMRKTGRKNRTRNR